MGGGLLQLVAYGAQDVYLTGNPQITFFKVVYRRHTNFAMESIEQSFNGNPSLGSRVSVLITRNGDLINRVYFKATLEAKTNPVALVPYAGLRLLKNVELEIGGQRIDKHYSEWLYIWNELSMPAGKKDGYLNMVCGNVLNAATELDNAAGNTKDIYVPLEFWFCRNVGLALPLIALQYHEVKVNIEFASQAEMIDKTETNFTKQQIDEDEPSGNNTLDGTLDLVQPQLWVDYIFLDTDERRRFAQLSHEYLIEQLQFTGSEKISKSASVDSLRSVRLNFNHPCKELIWVIKPDPETFTIASSASPITITGTTTNVATFFRKDTTASVPYWNNFTDNSFNEYVSGTTENTVEVAQGLETPAQKKSSVFASRNPCQKAKLQLNGNDRFSEREGSYFSIVQPYQHHENTPVVNASATASGINVYSFALKPEEHQPSGTLNMSRIDSAHLQISSKVDGIISVYAVNYNVLRILSGMGGLAYSN
jgi:hypothetical protein